MSRSGFISTMQLAIKRGMDIVGSLLGIIILSPLLFVLSLLIKLDSPGSIFFRQDRLGRNGNSFKIVKFRTMIVGAESIGDGLRITGLRDSRITKIGGFMRNTSLDELPQLFNVLKGDMSLVGPRPPATYFPYDGYDNYPDWAVDRFIVRPGITGLAQVTVRNSVSWDKRIGIDNEYIQQFNIWLDIRILFMTVIKVFKPQHLYPNPQITETAIDDEKAGI